MDTKPLSIYEKVFNAMAELDYIQKGDARVNHQYRFVSHDQVTARIHALQVKHRFLIIPTTKCLKQEGNRTEIIVACEFRNIDVPGEFYTIEFPGYGIDSSDKGIGKAISYAYKYAMLKAFSIETGDDPDEDQTSRYEAPKCMEFDTELAKELDEATWPKMQMYLVECADAMSMSTEDVKREAMKRLPEFMAAFKNWKPKGKK